MNAQSWSGSRLGTEWRFTCARSEREQVVTDVRRPDGSGTLVITTLFTGGRFSLSKDGPWGDGVQDLRGGHDAVTRSVRVEYAGTQRISADEQLTAMGRFESSRCALELHSGRAVPLGNTTRSTGRAAIPTSSTQAAPAKREGMAAGATSRT